jgi:hypothetical protein
MNPTKPHRPRTQHRPCQTCGEGGFFVQSLKVKTSLRAERDRSLVDPVEFPPVFGNWHTIYVRMNRWAKSGVLDRVFEKLQLEQIVRIKIEAFALHPTSVKVHPDGTGAFSIEEKSRCHWRWIRRIGRRESTLPSTSGRDSDRSQESSHFPASLVSSSASPGTEGYGLLRPLPCFSRRLFLRFAGMWLR